MFYHFYVFTNSFYKVRAKSQTITIQIIVMTILLYTFSIMNDIEYKTYSKEKIQKTEKDKKLKLIPI